MEGTKAPRPLAVGVSALGQISSGRIFSGRSLAVELNVNFQLKTRPPLVRAVEFSAQGQIFANKIFSLRPDLLRWNFQKRKSGSSGYASRAADRPPGRPPRPDRSRESESLSNGLDEVVPSMRCGNSMIPGTDHG